MKIILGLLFFFQLFNTKKYSAYEIYKLIETMEKLTKGQHTTFYELFGVSDKADLHEIGKAFRKLSIKLHPDKNKNNPKATRLFRLLSSVNEVLQDTGITKRELKELLKGNYEKDEEDAIRNGGRSYYNYILNKAPSWHRRVYYETQKQRKKTKKMNFKNIFLFFLFFGTFFHLSYQIILYLLPKIKNRINSKIINKKKNKKLLKKKEALQQEELPFPSIKKIFPFNFAFFCFKKTFRRKVKE